MGGETGVPQSVQVNNLQRAIRYCIPVMMCGFSSLQPAAIQLYFLCSTVLGGITTYALRQPAIRSLLRIRQIPSPESHKLYSKAVQGEVSLATVRSQIQKIKRQAPSLTTLSSNETLPTATSTTSSSILNVKPGISLPHHMVKHVAEVPKSLAERDVDFDKGMPKGYNVGKKWDWVKRNYRPTYVLKRMRRFLLGDSVDPIAALEQSKRKSKKAAAERYERERKTRLSGRG